jgi:putative membrane protein
MRLSFMSRGDPEPVTAAVPRSRAGKRFAPNVTLRTSTGDDRQSMSSFLAFLHHIAAFAFVAALVVELVLLRDELSLKTARKLPLVDLVAGASAGVVLIVGIVRVLYFEKGADYYLHSTPFLAKISLFVIIALLSIYPTIEFLTWIKPVREGKVPVLSDGKRRLLRAIIHAELGGVVLLILCAALMARGVGVFG